MMKDANMEKFEEDYNKVLENKKLEIDKKFENE